MIVIVQQHVHMNQNPVALMIISEDIQEFCPALIAEKNFLLLVASACDVIQSPSILNPNRPTHGRNFGILRLLCKISRPFTFLPIGLALLALQYALLFKIRKEKGEAPYGPRGSAEVKSEMGQQI